MSDDKPPRAARPRGFSELFRDAKQLAESAGLNLQELAEAVVSSAQSFAEELEKSEAWGQAKNVVEAGRDAVRTATERAASSARVAAERASSSVRDVRDQATRLVELLRSIGEHATDRAHLVDRFVEAAPGVAPQLDSAARAVVIGVLGEAGVGVHTLTGTELRYVRALGAEGARLVVSRLEGRGARLSAGAATSAYAGCLYGDPAVLAGQLRRRGADVGVAVAGFTFFRAEDPRDADARAGGWWVSLNAGLNLGIPILSDLAAWELDEVELGHVPLDAEDVDRIEAALSAAPDRGMRRSVAEKLAER
jgi:hypothetical protein